MSDISASARIDLSVNGQQPKAELESMKKQIINYREAMSEAAKAGDKVSYEKWRKELKSVEREFKNLQAATKNVEYVMRNLDKASPKELRDTLKTLEKQMQKIERGSNAWEEHKEKIKRVKETIKQVNSELALSESRWQRLHRSIQEYGNYLIGVVGAFTGLVMTGKMAVNKFAEMQQEMANVRKFTGMDEEDVERLNEAFKQMDTRSSREQLNQLAQEAGRLGKQSVEDVLGFVRAADKINVALDDLGDGATLTLSKLTQVFGDEQRLGTEKALLSVGSVVNELSQNCAASAPYLTEFASRMGGVGAQAGMTVQQIMGIASVLDASNQSMERSATALSNFITHLYQDPAKYAKAAGVDVKEFTDLLSKDANGALILFLEKINQLGGMESLAPLFADLKEKGSGMVSTLSSLAANIEFVKKQQEAANVAFEEAISIDKEFDVQNTTVQAGLDKAKKKFNELAVELGEHLRPVMTYAISSTSAMVRGLLNLINFSKSHITAIMVSVSAIAAYTIAVKANTIALTINNAAHKAGAVLMRLLKPLILACDIAYYKMTGNVTKAAAAQRLLNSSMMANPYAMIAAAIAALVVWMVRKYKEDQKAIAAAREKTSAEMRYKDAIQSVEAESEKNASRELSRVKILLNAAKDENLEREKRLKVVKALQRMYPDYFKSLTEEEIMAGKIAGAYERLCTSIREAAKARAAQGKIQEYMDSVIDLQSEEESLEKEVYKLNWLIDFWKKKEEEVTDRKLNGTIVWRDHGEAHKNRKDYESQLYYVERRLEEVKSEIAGYESAASKLEDKYLKNDIVDSIVDSEPEVEPIVEPEDDKKKGKTKEDKFKAEKEWREKEEAFARIAYARGESDYIEYTDRMNEILLEFYARQLEHTDLSESERLSITAQYLEQNKKMEEAASSESLEVENKRYAEESAIIKQHYVEGLISKETYDKRIIEIEIEHQRRMVAITEEGSKERLEAEKNLTELLIREMGKRKTEAEKKEREINKIKSEYFGDNLVDRQANYDRDMSLLDLAYERELQAVGDINEEKLRIDEAYEKAKIALKKEYALEAEEVDKNAVRKAVNASVEWLNGPGGKAVTGTMDVLVSGMASIFSQLSTIIQAELEMQTAAINKKYDAELSAAEGNSYRVAKLEKQKEKEIAKAKQEANRKQFNMQVIQAVAQTAQGAISAFSSAAATPIVGWILAPIAASMAIAAGMLQVQAIKKQQQASEAQGYSDGGFTKPGDVDEPAGIVHAGEWVASQKLVNSPNTRPLIDSLERAQRTNTIGTFKGFEAVGSPVAAVAYSRAAVREDVDSSKNIVSVMDRLNDRLDQPFVTVNTVTGDTGIKKAQDEYERLMRNKTPKSRRV